MPLSISHAGDRSTLHEALENLFPDHSPEDIARAAGAVDGSEVRLSSLDHNHIHVQIHHPHFSATRNFQKIYPPKKPSQIFVTHNSQEASGPLKGNGYQRFKDVIGRLRGLGVNHIRVESGIGSKDSPNSGFWVWPRFGFNGNLDEDHLQALTPELRSQLESTGKRDFHTLFDLPKGAEVWRERGMDTGNLRFDLDPQSEHSKRFENYYADRVQREAAKGMGQINGGGGSTGGGESTNTPENQTPAQGTQGSSKLDNRLARGMRGIKKLSRLREFLLQYKKSKFCCTMIPLEGEAADKIKAMGKVIKDEDLGEDGREEDPHITLLYGLHDSDPSKVKKLLSQVQRPIKFKLGKVSLFPGENSGKDYDVVKVEVHSPDLHKLNSHLKKLPHTDTHPTYYPHATIGYVKKGKGKEYAEKFGKMNYSGSANKVIFSDLDRNHTVIPLATQKVKMSQKDQPLKFNLNPPVHPLVKGFRIAHALKAIAKSPEASETSKKLALDVLHNGNTESLWGLHDSLLEDNHPLATKEDEQGKLVSGYRWLGAIPKLHLDSAVGKGLDAVQRVLEENGTPKDRARSLAHNYARMALAGGRRDFLPGGGFVDPGASNASSEAFSILRDQGHSPEDLQNSLNRNSIRDKDLGVTPSITKPNPEEIRTKATAPESPNHALDLSTRYKRLREVLKFGRTPLPRKGDFLSAMKRVQSRQSENLKSIAHEIFQKLHLNPLTVRPAIADSPSHSSSNQALAIEHGGDLEKAKYAAALYGLVSQSPALLLFHPGEGPDSLHKVTFEGSADKARGILDRLGITQRTFLPTSTGWQTLVPDSGSQLGDKVNQFAQLTGGKVTSATGTGEMIGGGQNSSADPDVRREYRKIVRNYESKNNPSPQPNSGVTNGSIPSQVSTPSLS